jgi:hypothetical protein
MKTAVWYTSTFVVIFVYLYCYLVQFIRGAEIRPQHLQPLLRSRLAAPLQQQQQPVAFPYPVAGGWPLASGSQHPAQQRHLPPLPPPPPPSEVFADYMGPGSMAVSSSMSVSSAASAPVQVPPSVSAAPATSSAAAKPLDFSYHNYEDMTTWLKQFSASNPDLTALYSIGKSVQGEQFISFLSCLGPIVKWLLALRRLRLSSSQSTYFCYCNLKLIAADPAAAAGWTKLPLFFSSSPFEKTKRKKCPLDL